MSTDRSTDDDQNGPGTPGQGSQDGTGTTGTNDGPGSGSGDPHNGSQPPAGDQGETAGGDGTDPDGTPNGEAAARRRQLRTAEAERDTLRARVETMQRADVERIAGEHLSVGGDLLALGTTLADVLDADGNVDADRVREAAAELVRARPGLRRGPSAAQTRNNIGQGSGPATAGRAGTSWSDALRPGR